MKAENLYPPAPSELHHAQRSKHRIRATGEFREPRKGEWFISGAIPEGYYAQCDLDIKYYIGERVKV